MARQAAGAPLHRAMAGWGARSHGPPAYRRVRWMLAATHALVRYGAIGNFAAPGAGGEDR
jgi:hypothetical protein